MLAPCGSDPQIRKIPTKGVAEADIPRRADASSANLTCGCSWRICQVRDGKSKPRLGHEPKGLHRSDVVRSSLNSRPESKHRGSTATGQEKTWSAIYTAGRKPIVIVTDCDARTAFEDDGASEPHLDLRILMPDRADRAGAACFGGCVRLLAKFDSLDVCHLTHAV